MTTRRSSRCVYRMFTPPVQREPEARSMPTGIEQPKGAENKVPLATDYSTAVQNPASCFSDAELAAGQPAQDMLGLPLTYAGGFANVYKMLCGEHSFAVKCFTRHVADLQERYSAISRHLEANRRKFAVEFRYL